MPPERIEDFKFADRTISTSTDAVCLLDQLFPVGRADQQIQKLGLTLAKSESVATHCTRLDPPQLLSTSFAESSRASLAQVGSRAAREFGNAAVYSSIEEPLLGVAQIGDNVTGTQLTAVVYSAFKAAGVEPPAREVEGVTWGGAATRQRSWNDATATGCAQTVKARRPVRQHDRVGRTFG